MKEIIDDWWENEDIDEDLEEWDEEWEDEEIECLGLINEAYSEICEVCEFRELCEEMTEKIEKEV
jgi:hypothetical protein